MSQKKIIVVDGANVAYLGVNHDGTPKAANMVAVKQALEERGYDPIIIIDAALRHDIDDPDQLEGLIESGKIKQAPAGTDADFFVLETAGNEHAQIVSNDTYHDYRDRFPWINKARVPVMMVNHKVELYLPDLKPNKD